MEELMNLFWDGIRAKRRLDGAAMLRTHAGRNKAPASPAQRGAIMKQPSNKAMNAWIQAQPRGNYTCSDCGKVGPDYEVQPQHPFYADGREGVARCVPCINAINERITAERKAELAKMARCELCNRRGTFVAAGQALLCGHHLKQARREHNRRMGAMGGMGLFMRPDYSREDILRMAARKGA